jgi:hypothetical protein
LQALETFLKLRGPFPERPEALGNRQSEDSLKLDYRLSTAGSSGDNWSAAYRDPKLIVGVLWAVLYPIDFNLPRLPSVAVPIAIGPFNIIRILVLHKCRNTFTSRSSHRLKNYLIVIYDSPSFHAYHRVKGPD